MELGGNFINENSLFNIVSTVYPQYKWLPWRFSNKKKSFWLDSENWKWFMQFAAKELNLNEMNDWYNVTSEVKKIGGKNS